MTMIPVGLSTSSVFPEGLERAFQLAVEIGYDGIELMVTADRLTQQADRIGELIRQYGLPVLSVHSPCLALSARVWGTDPIGKLDRSVELAIEIGARAVVAHPPFVWQRAAADRFAAAVADLAQGRAEPQGVAIAIENMYPVTVLGAQMSTYRPDWDVTATGYPGYTLDLSHTAVAGVDAMELARAMGGQLAHVHLGDGSGSGRDEHLVPGRGVAPCAEVLGGLATGAFGEFAGAVILEVSTRKSDAAQRKSDLTEALAFAREHLSATPRR